MGMQGSVIETGVDKLVNIVKERGRIALVDASKELGVSTTIIQEWMDFLEDEGLISIEYKLTKPFLVDRKLTKKEMEQKSKEFEGKKDIFVRKAEVSLSNLEKQSGDLRKVKAEFDKLKNELGMQLETVKSDLNELDKYQKMRLELQKNIEDQKEGAQAKMEQLARQISSEQKKYEGLVADIKKEKAALKKEKAAADSIEQSEQILNRKLGELKSMIATVDKKITEEDSAIKDSEDHIGRLNQVMESINQQVDEEKKSIGPLVQKSKELEKKVSDLQKLIVSKLAEKKKDAAGISDLVKKVNEFLNKKLKVVSLVDKVNKDRDDLEKSLTELIRKAKSFQLSAKGKDIEKDMVEMENKFKEVDKKKGIFEEELKKLGSFLRI